MEPDPIDLGAGKRSAAGLSWSAPARKSGIWIERDARVPFVNLAARVGLDVNEEVGIDARVGWGLRSDFLDWARYRNVESNSIDVRVVSFWSAFSSHPSNSAEQRGFDSRRLHH